MLTKLTVPRKWIVAAMEDVSLTLRNLSGSAAKVATPPRPSLVRKEVPAFKDAASANADSLLSNGRVVDTPSCVIPDFDPYNPIISRTIAEPSPDFVWCNASWPVLTDVVDGQFITINASLKHRLNVSYCEYQQVKCRAVMQRAARERSRDVTQLYIYRYVGIA